MLEPRLVDRRQLKEKAEADAATTLAGERSAAAAAAAAAARAAEGARRASAEGLHTARQAQRDSV